MVKLEVISTPLKRLKQTGNTDGKTGGDKPSNEKTETTGTTDGQTGGDPQMKRLEQEKLLMVKLEVINNKD